MRTLFFVLSIVLLSSCTHPQVVTTIDEPPLIVAPIDERVLTQKPLLMTCDYFPYDNSDAPCNLMGWQEFLAQSLRESKAEHIVSVLSLEKSPENEYKRLILNSSSHEPLNVRIQTTDVMFNIANANSNSFGNFFYLVAIYNQHSLLNEQSAIHFQEKLKLQIKKNVKLKKQLNDAQTKIQAIMDIERNLNTN